MERPEAVPVGTLALLAGTLTGNDDVVDAGHRRTEVGDATDHHARAPVLVVLGSGGPDEQPLLAEPLTSVSRPARICR